MTTILVDADIVCYRCAASAENEPQEIAIVRTDILMKNILQHGDSYLAFLSGPKETNFRYTINPEYKANRKDKVDPKHREVCKQFLIQEYGAITTTSGEGDDALGIHQTEDTIIASIDKDLLMIPGHHWNFVKEEYKEVSELDGLKAFYKQMLIGDPSDGIKGIDGIGKVKAAKFIDQLDNEVEMYQQVFSLYTGIAPKFITLTNIIDNRFNMNANCLWIMRNEEETYSKRMDRGKTKEFHYISPSTGKPTVSPKIPGLKECIHNNEDKFEEWEKCQTF
jgi:5'-3' exonuclease